jgi:Cu/Zn superoxide dismutase
MLPRFRRTTLALVSLAAISLVAAGCDDDDDDINNPPPPTTQTFTAQLAALNGTNANGTATFAVTGDELVATVNVTGVDPSIVHAQHIHLSATCPTSAADVNSDGFVSITEGAVSYGPVLVPLDGDLSSQAAGSTGFPTADANGVITFSSTTSVADLLADLRATDPDPTDLTVKIGANEDLDLANRTVVIHGVATTTTLPSTVETGGGATANPTLPIACGTIN